MNQDLVSTAEISPILIARDQPGFVQTPDVNGVVDRALLYLRAGLPVHFRGPAGTGKTTLAMYVAGQIGRPVILIHGDEEFGTSDLIGGETGYRVKKTVDNFIHTVLKTEEDVRKQWIDNRITVACKYGFTLLYDEFTRSRAEANNVLLAVLEERILDLPAERGGEDGHLQVHPDFRAMFTSNPQEYAGVHRAQDALRDRMITINLGHYDRETEIAITQAKSGIPRLEAEKITDIVRDFRQIGDHGHAPTVRAAIMIARVLREAGTHASPGDQCFQDTCLDILGSELKDGDAAGNGLEARGTVLELIKKHCQQGAPT
ncbi:MAG: gas vesicle protein GvpN [Dehalococcoidia bacterium]